MCRQSYAIKESKPWSIKETPLQLHKLKRNIAEKSEQKGKLYCEKVEMCGCSRACVGTVASCQPPALRKETIVQRKASRIIPHPYVIC